MSRFLDLTGQQFERLTVVSQAGRNKHNQVVWLCRCDCGNTTKVRTGELRSSHSQSCGCLGRERAALATSERNRRNIKHGHSRAGRETRTHCTWRSMLTRCTNSNHEDFHLYGGRGILVCDRWRGEHGFENFLADMGERPLGTSLDRIDTNGNYEPGNCRWATPAVQTRNQAKLDYQLADDIRWARTVGGLPINTLAAWYNVSSRTIWRVLAGEYWVRPEPLAQAA